MNQLKQKKKIKSLSISNLKNKYNIEVGFGEQGEAGELAKKLKDFDMSKRNQSFNKYFANFFKSLLINSGPFIMLPKNRTKF